MRRETIAIHGGYEDDPTTKAVAVPIYQTVAYAFDSADHARGVVQSRSRGISLQPYQQSDHGGAGAARGRARGRAGSPVRQHRAGRAQLCRAERHRTGHQHRLGSAALRNHPHAVRSPFAQPGSHRPFRGVGSRRRNREADRRQDPGGILRNRRQSRGKYLRHRGAGACRSHARRAADRRQHGRDAHAAAARSNTERTSWCIR